MQTLSPIYFGNKVYQKRQINHTKEQKSLTKPVETGALLGALLVAASLGTSCVIKSQRINKLTPDIKFVAAKTLKAAKEFAQKNLKIDPDFYMLSDLETANYINEALVNCYNKTKINKQLIKYIDSEKMDYSFASIRTSKFFGNYLSLNSNLTEAADNSLKRSLHKIDDTFLEKATKIYNLNETQINLINKFLYDTENLSLKEKMHLCTFAPLIDTENLDMAALYSDFLSEKFCLEIIQKESLPKTICEFINLDNDKKEEIIIKLNKNYNYKLKVCDSGPFGIIYHEFGHILHKEKIGARNFYKQMWVDASSNEDDMVESIKKFLKEEETSTTILGPKLGAYALTSPAEYVAEVYSCKTNNQFLNSEIMKVYNKYKGP